MTGAERGAFFNVNFRNDSRRRGGNADERTSRLVANVTGKRKRLAVFGRLEDERSGVPGGDSDVREREFGKRETVGVFGFAVNVSGGSVRRVFNGVVAVRAVNMFRFCGFGNVAVFLAADERPEGGDGEESRENAERAASVATRFRCFHDALCLR